MADDALEKKKESLEWGKLIATGFALAFGSAMFAGTLYLGKLAFKRKEMEEEE